jgi:4-methylaminobutanoate oxidase (formaldehyde-forming)
MGWEGVNWFARAGTKPVVEYGWGRQNWFGPSAAEHAAARSEVALFDQTSFAKVAVRGPDAEAALQYLCSNDVAISPGRTVYTAVLNDRGGYEADVTVTRIRWNEYLLVTSSAQGVHDLDLLRRSVPAGLRRVLRRHVLLRRALGHGPRSRCGRAVQRRLPPPRSDSARAAGVDLGRLTSAPPG